MREEAGELCQTLEQDEGQERAASEMADLLYHSMVLLKAQVAAYLACQLQYCSASILRIGIGFQLDLKYFEVNACTS